MTLGDMSEFDVIEVGVDTNHVHLVVSSKPTLAPVEIVRRLWKLHYDHLAKFFWGNEEDQPCGRVVTFVNSSALFRREPLLSM